MKKKFTFSAVLILITFIGFAQQCPTFFRRNNGNGTCGMESEIKMYFATCPVTAPLVDSVYVNGVKQNLVISSPNTSKCASSGYISYCFNGNLPPVSGIQVFFNYGTVNGTGTSCFVPEGGPLPVLLSSFEIQRKGTSVIASWETQQELNSSRFEIQRSSNNSAFETVGIVASKNSNSSIPQFYSFTDNSNSSKEVSFYRIKLIDIDAAFTFSATKAVKGSAGTTDFVVFPNPSAGNAKITITDLSEPTNIMIFDNSGRLIKQTTLISSNSFEINNLQKGGYTIKITGEKSGTSSVKKLSVIY